MTPSRTIVADFSPDNAEAGQTITRPSAEDSSLFSLARHREFMLTLTVLFELEVDDLVDSTGMYKGAAEIIAVS